MAHMIRLQIEHDTKGQVKPIIVNNLGSAVIEHNAILNDNAQISATRYTGTDLVGALNSEPITNTKKLRKLLKQVFKRSLIKHSLTHMALKIPLHLQSLKKQLKSTI